MSRWVLPLALVLGAALSGCGPAKEEAVAEGLAGNGPLHGPRAGGFVIISGDDADDATHCQGTRCGRLFPNLFKAGLSHSHSGGTGILAIGVNGGNARVAFNSWNLPANGGPGAPVTFLTLPSQIASVNFNDYAMLYLPSSASETSGGLTVVQIAELNKRQPAIADFVNVKGGSLIALTQAETPGGWGFLPVPLTTEDMEFERARPTAELMALSPDTNEGNLTHNAFHNVFTGPSGYSGLTPLAINVEPGSPGFGKPVMLGGAGVILTAEVCDDGVDNDGDHKTDSEDEDCWACGNGHVDPGETCDDGNTEDGDGCSHACELEMNLPPVAVCEEPMTVCTDAGRCEAIVTGLGAASYDPEGDPLTTTQSPAGPYAVGTRDVQVTVSDGSDEQDACSVRLTVNDCEAPKLTCPAPFRVECSGDGQAPVTPPAATATDNCAEVTVNAPVPGSQGLGETVLVYSATDAAGNTGTCSTPVTVEDTQAPSISCPAPAVAECTGERSAMVQPGDASGQDSCGPVTVSSVAAQRFPLGTTSISFTATDIVGHTATCSSSVTVRDTTPPSMVCPEAVSAECSSNRQASVDLGAAQASDVCGSASASDPGPTSYPLGTTAVTLTAQDEAGNTAVCTSAVTVHDTTPPSISCPAPVVAECSGEGGARVDPAPAEATEGCTTAAVNDPPSALYPLGTSQVAYTATDEAGNAATCSSAITVKDTLPPSLVCPAPVVAECTANRQATVNPGVAQVSDVCGGASATGPGTGSYSLGTTPVTFTARDEAGNQATCASAVTVRDTTAPSISCPVPVVAECTGNARAEVSLGAAQVAEACTSATVESPASGSYPLGTTQVAYTARDEAGNAAACTSAVTVRDTLAPSISCPAPIVAECTGNGGAHVTPGVATATDVCTAASVTGPSAGHYPAGTTMVTYRAMDSGGNEASCSSTIQVVDHAAPVVTVTNPNPLWPPNHKYRTVSLADCGVVVRDACGGALDLATAQASITCVTSDEPPNSNGDGNTSGDIVIVNATTVTLRGERKGKGDGRVYEIHFKVSDASGNVATGICPVAVPHDQSGRPAVDSGDAFRVCRL